MWDKYHLLDLVKESTSLMPYVLRGGMADSPKESDPFLVSQRGRNLSRKNDGTTTIPSLQKTVSVR